MNGFNWVDYAIIGVVTLSIIISLVRGFVREAFSLLTWIGAIWVGVHFASTVSVWLQGYIHSSPIRMGAAFVLLFAAALLVGSIVSFSVVKLIQKTGLSGTDRSLGVVFGLVRGFVVVAVALLIAHMMFVGNPAQLSSINQSQLAPKFRPLMDWLREFLPEAPNPTKIIHLSGLAE